MGLIRVRADSRTHAVAGSIAGMIRAQEQVEIQAIGPHAVNQAVKAVAIAHTFLAEDPSPYSLACAPSFVELEVEGKERTAIRLTVLATPVPNLG